MKYQVREGFGAAAGRVFGPGQLVTAGVNATEGECEAWVKAGYLVPVEEEIETTANQEPVETTSETTQKPVRRARKKS